MARLMLQKRPFKLLKLLTPKTLLGRFLLILVLPMFLVQFAIGIVFWNRHWSKTTEIMAGQIAGNIVTILDLATQNASDKYYLLLQTLYNRNSDMIINRTPLSQGFLHKTKQSSWQAKIVEKALKSKIKHPYMINALHYNIAIEIATDKYMYTFHIKKRNLFPHTIYLVIWWEICTPIFFLLIAILFMKNQIRPLQQLARAVKQFGKNREISTFSPAGAKELRIVGQAFKTMQSRIQEQIGHRMQMLAGISHDLKTPLTRMQLQIALLHDQKAAKSLENDVQDMQNLIEEYLNFAKGQKTEQFTNLPLEQLIQSACVQFSSQHINIDLSGLVGIILSVKQNAIIRAFKNIISNALRYGTNLWITGALTPQNIIIYFADDGPGIPVTNREDVFTPFFRLDTSRNKATGGHGLGLSITKDIINYHGGSILLSDSKKYKGLQMAVYLPK